MTKIKFKKSAHYYEASGSFMMDTVKLRICKDGKKWDLKYLKEGELMFKCFSEHVTKTDANESANYYFGV